MPFQEEKPRGPSSHRPTSILNGAVCSAQQLTLGLAPSHGSRSAHGWSKAIHKYCWTLCSLSFQCRKNKPIPNTPPGSMAWSLHPSTSQRPHLEKWSLQPSFTCADLASGGSCRPFIRVSGLHCSNEPRPVSVTDANANKLQRTICGITT